MKRLYTLLGLLLTGLLLFIGSLQASADRRKEVAATPANISESRLLFADHVFALPGRSFMQRIHTVPADAPIEVTGLPEGLYWNADRRRVEGFSPAEGEYRYQVNLILTDRVDSARVPHEVTLSVRRTLPLTRPVMGWISWNVVQDKISTDVIKSVADNMDKWGLKNAGYDYLIIDDLWHAPTRHDDGAPREDSLKFPKGMAEAVKYVHDRGLKFGIYSDAAERTCAGAFGSLGYEEKDARQYAAWGVDLLKYDYCHAPEDALTARQRYAAMSEALRSSGRDIVLYACEWGVRRPWLWGAETGASLWRATYDTRDCWQGKPGGIGVMQSIEQMKDLWPYGGVNRFNDADMMCVGIHGKGKSSSDLCATGPGMTQDEYRTQFALWCMWSSPLLLSFDLSKPISDDDMALITNPDLIAINQDELCQPAEFVGQDGDLLYFSKPLSNGDLAIAVTNVGEKERALRLDFTRFAGAGVTGPFTVRDCQLRQDVGVINGGMDARVRSHATLVYRLSDRVNIGLPIRKNLEKTDPTLQQLPNPKTPKKGNVKKNGK